MKRIKCWLLHRRWWDHHWTSIECAYKVRGEASGCNYHTRRFATCEKPGCGLTWSAR